MPEQGQEDFLTLLAQKMDAQAEAINRLAASNEALVDIVTAMLQQMVDEDDQEEGEGQGKYLDGSPIR